MINFLFAVGMGLFGLMFFFIALWFTVTLAIAFYEDGKFAYIKWKRESNDNRLKMLKVRCCCGRC